jgi:multiple antibiotic resistance protein
MELVTRLIHNTLLLLAVMNPIGGIPTYVDVTKSMETQDRRRTLDLAAVTSLVIVVLFALIGQWSLDHLFAVKLEEFKIAGGIMLFVVAIQGVTSGMRGSVLSTEESKFLAVFPLAFPIIAGPGTLTVTIILAQDTGPFEMMTIALMAFVVVFLIVRNSVRIMELIGPYAGMVIPRLLYIFLAAKAVSMILAGIATFIKQNFPAI